MWGTRRLCFFLARIPTTETMSKLQAEETHTKLHPRADASEPGSMVANILEHPEKERKANSKDEEWSFPATPGMSGFGLGGVVRAHMSRSALALLFLMGILVSWVEHSTSAFLHVHGDRGKKNFCDKLSLHLAWLWSGNNGRGVQSIRFVRSSRLFFSTYMLHLNAAQSGCVTR
jgi:hypothetical protein